MAEDIEYIPITTASRLPVTARSNVGGRSRFTGSVRWMWTTHIGPRAPAGRHLHRSPTTVVDLRSVVGAAAVAVVGVDENLIQPGEDAFK